MYMCIYIYIYIYMYTCIHFGRAGPAATRAWTPVGGPPTHYKQLLDITKHKRYVYIHTNIIYSNYTRIISD